MTPRIKITNLHQQYDKGEILSGLNLTAGPGETVAIVGRSGCGKSTLLRTICLLEDAQVGEVEMDGEVYLVNGKAIVAPEKIRSECTMVFQEFNLFPAMTVSENITLALRHVRGFSKEDARKKATELAERLGIVSILGNYPNELSGGQAQRVALCRALVLHPKVLCLDEITSALDAETILDVVDAIRHIRSLEGNGKMAILLVTHLIKFAVEFADRIVFMHEGKVWEDLPAHQFLTGCQKPETKQFVSNYVLPI